MSTESKTEVSPFDLLRAIGRLSKSEKDAPSDTPIGSSRILNEVEAAASVPKQAVPYRPAADGVEQWPLPGLAPMTRVRTSFGDVHAIALRTGDEVLTRSGEYRAIKWLNRINLDGHVLKLKPDSNPVVIAAGALGPQAPANEIMVSPRQVVCAGEGAGISTSREAAMLISKRGVRRLVESELSYTMFHLGEDADVYCEGLFMRFPMDA